MGVYVKVLYEDNHIMVVEKEPNQPVMEDDSKDYDLLNEVKNYVKIKYDKPGNAYIGLVHRLDRPVGGVMVFAKTSKAASRLSESIRKNQLEKRYFAVVEGVMRQDQEVLENWLYKDEIQRTSYVCDENKSKSKLAKLKYQVVKTISNLTLLDIELYTGRHHQIRVQLSNIGNPIYGDMKYGNGPKGNIALFAYSLGFVHPVSKQFVSFVGEPDYSIPPWPLFK